MGEADTNDCPPGSKPLVESAPLLIGSNFHACPIKVTQTAHVKVLMSAICCGSVSVSLHARMSVKLRRATSGRATWGLLISKYFDKKSCKRHLPTGQTS